MPMQIKDAMLIDAQPFTGYHSVDRKTITEACRIWHTLNNIFLIHQCRSGQSYNNNKIKFEAEINYLNACPGKDHRVG